MGVANYPNIFQQEINDLFHALEFIRACIYDLYILTKRDWTDHVQKLELILNKLKVKGPKFNIEISFCGQTKMEFLCFWGTRDGVKPINKKIKAITNMMPSPS